MLRKLPLTMPWTRTLRRGNKSHVSQVIFSSEAQVNPLGPRYSGLLPAFTYRNGGATTQLPLQLAPSANRCKLPFPAREGGKFELADLYLEVER